MQRIMQGILGTLAFCSMSFAHEHWINDGKYLDPETKAWCCDERDCHPIKDLSRIRHEGSNWIVDGAYTFSENRVMNSEDDDWWLCGGRCLFRPRQV